MAREMPAKTRETRDFRRCILVPFLRQVKTSTGWVISIHEILVFSNIGPDPTMLLRSARAIRSQKWPQGQELGTRRKRSLITKAISAKEFSPIRRKKRFCRNFSLERCSALLLNESRGRGEAACCREFLGWRARDEKRGRERGRWGRAR